jgi:carbon monoxide dehydrogenase subunit G
MPTITATETIHAPAERVFAVVTDIPRAAERIRGIEKIEVLSTASAGGHPSAAPPVGPGFTWRETRTMMGRQATETMSITVWDPPRGYTVEARSYGNHYRTPITVEPLGPGTTRLTMTFHITPETLLAKVLTRLFSFMNKHLAKCMQDDLRDIKAFCESGTLGRS